MDVTGGGVCGCSRRGKLDKVFVVYREEMDRDGIGLDSEQAYLRGGGERKQVLVGVGAQNTSVLRNTVPRTEYSPKRLSHSPSLTLKTRRGGTWLKPL